MPYFRKLKNRASVMMGTSVLSHDFMNFAGMHALFIFATTLSSVFVSTFLFKENASFTTVGLFYLWSYVFEMIGCFLVVSVSGRFSGTVLSRTGLLLYTASYLLLLIVQGEAVKYFPVVAFLMSVGNAFYWVPYHRYTVSYTNSQNRQRGIGFLGFAGNFIMLIAPVVSGSIISGLPGLSGYMTVFVVSVVSFICAALVSRKLPATSSGKHGNILWRFLHEKTRVKTVYLNLLGNVLYGARDGVYMYFLNILVYSMTANELIIGFNITGRGVLSMAVFYFAGRIRKPRMRLAMLLLSCVLQPILSAGLFVWYTAAVVILINVLDAGVASLFNNSWNYISYEMADFVSGDGEDRLIEALSMRNAAFNIGRALGVFLFLLAPVDQTHTAVILLALNLIALLSGPVFCSASAAARTGEA